MDGSGGIELDPLTAGLAGADAAGSRVEQAGQLELRGLLPELEVPLVARVEVLHRRMELRALGAELFDRALQLLDRVGLPGIDRGEEGEPLGMPLDDRANEFIPERWAVRRGLGIPGEQNPKDLLLGKLHGELVDAALMDLSAKIFCRALAVGTHTAIEPFL